MDPIIADQLTLPVAPPEFYRFEDFQPGDNGEVVSYLQKWVTSDQRESDLCFISGKAGTGKTHLLHAIAELATQNQLAVVYFDLVELLALSPECLLGMEQYQIVCLDNLHILTGNLPWQQAVFDLINRVLEADKRIVFSADKLPKALDLELKDLVSRLDWGVNYSLKPLSDEQLVQALITKASSKGLTLPIEVAKFLLKHFRRDMGSLVEVLEKLDQRSLQTQRNLTIPFVKTELGL